ncbi:MAG: hypothetical protein WKF84_00045 [Pyrinomonadaceae bacterium]
MRYEKRRASQSAAARALGGVAASRENFTELAQAGSQRSGRDQTL